MFFNLGGGSTECPWFAPTQTLPVSVITFITSYFLPTVEKTEHEFINKENLKWSIIFLRLEKGILKDIYEGEICS